MEDPTEDKADRPIFHPEEQPAGTDDSPKFGRLLIVLVLAVVLIGIITFASEKYFSQ